jgi:hypothetical protein
MPEVFGEAGRNNASPDADNPLSFPKNGELTMVNTGLFRVETSRTTSGPANEQVSVQTAVMPNGQPAKSVIIQVPFQAASGAVTWKEFETRGRNVNFDQAEGTFPRDDAAEPHGVAVGARQTDGEIVWGQDYGWRYPLHDEGQAGSSVVEPQKYD